MVCASAPEVCSFCALDDFFRSLLNRLDSLLDRSRPRNRLGSLRRLDIMYLPAIRAGCDLGIVIGHLVQKGRKRLAAVIA